jgi:hypothetical protein
MFEKYYTSVIHSLSPAVKFAIDIPASNITASNL